MTVVLSPEVLRARARDLNAQAAEILGPFECTSPGYGAPGYAHCAACCGGTGYVVTCEEDEHLVAAGLLLGRAALALRLAAGDFDRGRVLVEQEIRP